MKGDRLVAILFPARARGISFGQTAMLRCHRSASFSVLQPRVSLVCLISLIAVCTFDGLAVTVDLCKVCLWCASQGLFSAFEWTCHVTPAKYIMIFSRSYFKFLQSGISIWEVITCDEYMLHIGPMLLKVEKLMLL